MARLGTFDADLRPLAVFDGTLLAEGWFDEEWVAAAEADPGTIGQAGGTFNGLGAKCTIPADALTEDNVFAIEAGTAISSPGTVSRGNAFRFTPAGLTFLIAVTCEIPYIGSASGLFVLRRDDTTGAVTRIQPTATSNGLTTFLVSAFSTFQAAAGAAVSSGAATAGGGGSFFQVPYAKLFAAPSQPGPFVVMPSATPPVHFGRFAVEVAKGTLARAAKIHARNMVIAAILDALDAEDSH